MRVRTSLFDIVVNIICGILLFGMVIFLVAYWESIPDKIPMHYDLMGQVNRWGDKSEIVFLPIISFFLYFLLTVVEYFPSSWNTSVKITPYNRDKVYRMMKNLLVSTKLLMVVLFVFLSFQTVFSLELTVWFMPIT
ncbi:MAG: DUF1648 domain-containing protein, partial [Erysipelotrichaceae bacterium]